MAAYMHRASRPALKIIKDLMKQGLNYQQIAEHLNRTGLPPSKAETWNRARVAGLAFRQGLRKRRQYTRTSPTPQRPRNTDLAALKELVIESNIDTRKKVQVLDILG